MSCHGATGGNSQLDSGIENGQTPSMEDTKSFDPYLPMIDSGSADCGMQSPSLSLGDAADHQSTCMMQVKLPPKQHHTVLQTQMSLPAFRSFEKQSVQRTCSVPLDSTHYVKKVKPGE